MPDDGLPLEQLLPLYAEVTVRIGLNLQPGQRLLILGPVANGGASLDAAPLVRHVAATAYAAGSVWPRTCSTHSMALPPN